MYMLVPTQDSLQEFKVETNNLTAEFGKFAGGVINMSTKGGHQSTCTEAGGSFSETRCSTPPTFSVT